MCVFDVSSQIILGRWKEAALDLEYALSRLKQDASTHAAMTQSYKALGMKDLAAEHERLAQFLSRGKKP